MKHLLIALILFSLVCLARSQEHSKFFVGIGYNIVLSEKLSTGVLLSSGRNQNEAMLSGTSSGIYVDWLKYYINPKLVIEASTIIAFVKQETQNAANLNYDASARLITNSVFLRYNLANTMTKDKTIFNFFLGLGPGIAKFKNLSATLDDLSTTMTVNAQYSNYVPSVSSKIGIEFLTQPPNWSKYWILFNLDVKASFALKKQTITEVEQKLNEAIIQSGLKPGDQVNPNCSAFSFGICLGF